MRLPKIFISHSSKSDENLAFLENLCAALDDGNRFDILVDLKLHPGDKWHAKINEWMHECDAAIILLTEDALKSNWVQAESTFVAVRNRNEKEFKLIPVLLNNVTAESITKHRTLGSGSAAHLDETQFIANQPDEDAIIASIKTELDGLIAAQTPFDDLGRVAGSLLKQADKDSLEAAWQQLQGDDKPELKASLGSGAEMYADALMRYLLRQNHDCLSSFKAVVNKIHPKLEPGRAVEFYQCIRALWVESAAAACLRGVNNREIKMSAMNGKYLHQFTFERYTERAWPLDNRIKMIKVTSSTDPDEIRKEMHDHFQKSRNPSNRIPPEICDHTIRESDDTILVCIPADEGEGGLPDNGIRYELSEAYPNVIFVMGTGENLPPALPSDVLGIEPPLKMDFELRQFANDTDVSSFLKSYCNREI